MLKKIQKNDPHSNNFYNIYVSRVDHAKTLYFIGSYGGRLVYFQLFLQGMVQSGYRVVYLQPTKDVLSVEHPDWLGRAVDQISQYITKDIAGRNDQASVLVGVSLGSFIGLNVLQKVRFKKFAVVAGGAPLRGVLRSNLMFHSARTKLKKQKTGFEKVDQQWEPYDRAFADLRLNNTSILLLNSNKDEVIKPSELAKFLKQLEKTGAKIESRLEGNAPHVIQALSINWRGKEIRQFLESE